MPIILHITTQIAWETAVAGGEYQVESLVTEGFIHCSTASQVTIPANEIYRGQTGLILLVIDPARVQARLVYEDCYESGQAFPHIYGPLNLNAVLGTVTFPPGEDGRFTRPSALASYLA